MFLENSVSSLVMVMDLPRMEVNCCSVELLSYACGVFKSHISGSIAAGGGLVRSYCVNIVNNRWTGSSKDAKLSCLSWSWLWEPEVKPGREICIFFLTESDRMNTQMTE